MGNILEKLSGVRFFFFNFQLKIRKIPSLGSISIKSWLSFGVKIEELK